MNLVVEWPSLFRNGNRSGNDLSRVVVTPVIAVGITWILKK